MPLHIAASAKPTIRVPDATQLAIGGPVRGRRQARFAVQRQRPEPATGRGNEDHSARGQPEQPIELPTNCATNCPRRVEHLGRLAFLPSLLPRTRQKPRRGWL